MLALIWLYFVRTAFDVDVLRSIFVSVDRRIDTSLRLAHFAVAGEDAVVVGDSVEEEPGAVDSRSTEEPKLDLVLAQEKAVQEESRWLLLKYFLSVLVKPESTVVIVAGVLRLNADYLSIGPWLLLIMA